MPESRRSPVVPAILAGVAAIGLVVVLVMGQGGDSEAPATVHRSGSGSSDATATTDPQDPLAGLARREPGDPMARGDVDAPVVMINYSDFQCPYCGRFARETAPALVEQYVERGILRIEWRDFPYLGEESLTAAKAGRAAAAQDRFWDFHDALYANQLPPNSGNLDTDHVAAIARDLGLDVQQFRADMRSERTMHAIARDFEEGQRIGVNGTPAFLINGTPVIGARPLATFEQAIEDAAAAAADGP